MGAAARPTHVFLIEERSGAEPHPTPARFTLPPPPLRLSPCSNTRHRFWFENPVVGRPIREESAAAAMTSADQRLFPRECREAVSAGQPCVCASRSSRAAALRDASTNSA